MKRFGSIALTITMVLLFSLAAILNSNYAYAAENGSEGYTNDNKIPYKEGMEIEGAAGVERQGDVIDSPYFKHIDYYNLESTDTLTILTNFKTTQQTTEWTCGPASLLMVLEWYDARNGQSDMDLVQYRKNDVPGATTLQQMINVFDALGGFDVYSTYDLEDPSFVEENFIVETLKTGTPIILGTDEWGGHWQVIIGYDDLGTPNTADDVIILGDPYDTTDHDQDGYVVQSFERLYYNWINSFDPDFQRNVFLVATPKE